MMRGCNQICVFPLFVELENAERVAATLLRRRPVGMLQDLRNAHPTADMVRQFPLTSAVGRCGGEEAAASYVLSSRYRMRQLQVSQSHPSCLG